MSFDVINVEPFETNSDCSTSLSNDITKSDDITENSLANSGRDLSIYSKVKHLIAAFKEVQLNLNEVGAFMIENKGISSLTQSLPCEKISEEKHSINPLDGIESTKTDEDKLNEILELLHHIASNLATYEQNPILLGSPSKLEDDNHAEANINDENITRENLEFDRKDYYCIARSTENHLNSSFQSNIEVPDHNLSVYTQTDVDDMNFNQNECTFGEKRQFSNFIAADKNTNHLFSTQTKFLRKEIDEIIQRKEALDGRLQLLFEQRKHRGKEKRAQHSNESQEHTKINNKKSRKHRHREKSLGNKCKVDETRNVINDLCPAKPFINNGDKIEELRQEEELFLGSAENGLSSEINSLSLTIQELVSENQHFYSFFQGIAAQNSLQDVKPSKNPNEYSEHKTPHEIVMSSEMLVKDSNTMSCESKDVFVSAVMPPDSVESKNEHLQQLNTYVYNSDKNGVGFDTALQIVPEKECVTTTDKHISQLMDKTPKDATSSLEMKIDSAIEKSSQQFQNCANEIEKINFKNQELTDHIDSLFIQNKELHTNIKNLGIDNVPQEFNKGNSQISSLCSSGNIVEPHKACLSHIEKLVCQNQSLHRQLFLVKSQLRKNSFPGALKVNKPSSQYSVDGNYISCSTPASDLELCSEPSKDHLKLSEMDDNSCLEDELEDLKSKVIYLENFMTTQANKATVDTDESVDAKLENEICDTSLFQEYISDNNEAIAKNSYETGEPEKLQFNEKDLLQKKIKILLLEKQSLTNRMEELMVISQELAYHFKNTKEELSALTIERNALHNNLTRLSQSTVNIPDKELYSEQQTRTRELENDLEKAWRLLHERTLEKDKIISENTRMERAFESSLAHLKDQNESLRKDSISLKKDLAELRIRYENKDAELQKMTHQMKLLKSQIDTIDGEPTHDIGLKEVPADLSEENLRKAGKEWQHSVDWLQKCLAEEKLHGRLLEAAEHESIARVAVLQQALKESGNMYTELQTKYQKLRKIVQAKKSDKYKHREVLKDCRGRVEELKVTTSALEDTYKIMLSTLGQNIGICVDLLSSHLYLSPGSIHPSPELSDDPTFWFAAQCSRLRWLQAQLKRLGLHAWKGTGGDLTKNTFEESFATRKLPQTRSFDIPQPPHSDTKDLPVKHISAPPSLSGKNSAKKLETSSQDRILHPKSKLLESNIWATLNDVEINLTNQQIKLFENKSKQLDSLAAILNKESLNSVSKSSENVVSEVTTTELSVHSEDFSNMTLSGQTGTDVSSSTSEMKTYSEDLKHSSQSESKKLEAAASLQSISDAESESTLKSSLDAVMIEGNDANIDSKD